jgi:class 3 adenylate cyclase
LFCDIADSTGLSERRDPEDLRDVLLAFQRLSTGCIEAAGGKGLTIDQNGGRCLPLWTRSRAAADESDFRGSFFGFLSRGQGPETQKGTRLTRE